MSALCAAICDCRKATSACVSAAVSARPRVSDTGTCHSTASATASHTSCTHSPEHCDHGHVGARSAPVACATCSCACARSGGSSDGGRCPSRGQPQRAENSCAASISASRSAAPSASPGATIRRRASSALRHPHNARGPVRAAASSHGARRKGQALSGPPPRGRGPRAPPLGWRPHPQARQRARSTRRVPG